MANIGGIVFVRVRLGGSIITRHHHGTMLQVAQASNGLCFPSHTTELIGYGEAAEQSLPVWMTSTDNADRAARKHEYERITKEFVSRFK